LDKETGLYYFGARYYDARMSRWISTDPAFVEGKYFPKPNDYDTEHDFYWYLQQDGSKKLPGIGGVFNAVNMDVYHYAGNNPVKLVDPDGNQSFPYDIGNPLSFMIDLLKSKYETTFNEARNTTISTSAGFATGFIKGFFGPDFTKLVEKCGKEMQGFYVEEFMAAIDTGEITGQVAGILNFSVGSYQSGKDGFKLGFDLGRNTFKEIMSNPNVQKEFITGLKKGFIPSMKPPKFTSLAEGIGYIFGNWSYNRLIEKLNDKLNK
jgi:RHS repeat-associated protein